MSNATCALSGRTISGFVMPRFLPRSRYAFTAINTDSVPPVVMVPVASGPPFSIVAVIRTTSASMRRRLLKAIGLRAFSEK